MVFCLVGFFTLLIVQRQELNTSETLIWPKFFFFVVSRGRYDITSFRDRHGIYSSTLGSSHTFSFLEERKFTSSQTWVNQYDLFNNRTKH